MSSSSISQRSKSTPNTEKLPYDQTNPRSLKTYIQNKNLQTSEGHQYYLDKAHNRIIFLPDGDKKNICCLRVRIYENNQWVAPHNIDRMARVYCTAYHALQTHKKELEQDKKAFNFKCIVFDMKSQTIRGVIDPDKFAPEKITSGTVLKLADEKTFWSDVDKILEPSKNEPPATPPHKRKPNEKSGKEEVSDTDSVHSNDDPKKSTHSENSDSSTDDETLHRNNNNRQQDKVRLPDYIEEPEESSTDDERDGPVNSNQPNKVSSMD